MRTRGEDIIHCVNHPRLQSLRSQLSKQVLSCCACAEKVEFTPLKRGPNSTSQPFAKCWLLCFCRFCGFWMFNFDVDNHGNSESYKAFVEQVEEEVLPPVSLINSSYYAQMRAWKLLGFFFHLYCIDSDMLLFLSCDKCTYCMLLWTKASAKCP